MEAPDSATLHLESMLWLAKELAPDRIEVREHQFTSASFGSFVTTLGTGKREIRFTWDGRDAILSIDFRENREQQWIHDANVSVPNGEGLYAEIASQAISMFTV